LRYRGSGECVGVNPHDKMMMDRTGIILALLFAAEVPMGIQPMRITRREGEFSRPVRLGQLRAARRRLSGSRNRAENKFTANARARITKRELTRTLRLR